MWYPKLAADAARFSKGWYYIPIAPMDCTLPITSGSSQRIHQCYPHHEVRRENCKAQCAESQVWMLNMVSQRLTTETVFKLLILSLASMWSHANFSRSFSLTGVLLGRGESSATKPSRNVWSVRVLVEHVTGTTSSTDFENFSPIMLPRKQSKPR